MGTEVAISFSSLRAQLESEKSSLFKIDENIKKIVQTSGRFTDRFNASGDYQRGGSRIGGRNSYPDVTNNYKNDDQTRRKYETKTVFSRLSARAHDSDGEEEGPGSKRARMPSAVCRELPTRAAVLRAQGDDEQARTRNRRIFGSLLGTLQKFKQEEIVLQTKEDKKAQVERKIEEQARQEKEREQKERKTLFAEREHKKASIKALEAKMGRVQEFEKWEASQRCLENFILTKASPNIYWLPKKMSEKAQEKLEESSKYHQKCLLRKRQELQEELRRIEQKCMRPRGFAAKENALDATQVQGGEPAGGAGTPGGRGEPVTGAGPPGGRGERGSKRDKFAMDVDEKDRDDSDADERPAGGDDGGRGEDGPDSEESKMDTTIEQNTSVVVDDIKNITTDTNDISAADTSSTNDTSAVDTSVTMDTSAADTNVTNDTTAATTIVANDTSASNTSVTNETRDTNDTSTANSSVVNDSSAANTSVTNDISAANTSVTNDSSAATTGAIIETNDSTSVSEETSTVSNNTQDTKDDKTDHS